MILNWAVQIEIAKGETYLKVFDDHQKAVEYRQHLETLGLGRVALWEL